MCGTTITEVDGKYKVWLDSRGGRPIRGVASDVSIINFDNIPIFNIDPKFQQSLVYVKCFYINATTDQAITNNVFVISIQGKSFPHNFQTQIIGNRRLQEGAGTTLAPVQNPAINNDTNSRVLAFTPNNYQYFGGSAKVDGILCGDTFINGGSFDVKVDGVDDTQTRWIIELEIELVENVRTLNPNVIKH